MVVQPASSGTTSAPSTEQLRPPIQWLLHGRRNLAPADLGDLAQTATYDRGIEKKRRAVARRSGGWVTTNVRATFEGQPARMHSRSTPEFRPAETKRAAAITYTDGPERQRWW